MKRIIWGIAAIATLALPSCCDKPVKSFEEAADPQPLCEKAAEEWNSVSGTLNGAWSDHDMLYSRSEVPTNISREVLHLAGWRGERVSAMALLWSADEVRGVECEIADFKSEKASLPAEIATTHFVRYTLSDERHEGCLCGRLPNHPKAIYPDMLDSLDRFDMQPRTTRPVWIKIKLPQDAAPGVYRSELVISHRGCGKLRLPFEIEVVDQVLADASEWGFHLDLWQHPSAVARMRGLEMWSDEHFEALREEMKPLVEAGQKVITATLNRDPWRFQCNDDYESMIRWTLNEDGSWSYDYTIFDRWVELMMEMGVNKQINCYSMLPWGDCRIEYWDGPKNRGRIAKAIPGTPVFEQFWAPFLVDFAKHLKEKGWINITNIAVDERAPEDMDEAARLIAKYAPELGFALADNHDSYKRYANMRDVCVSIKHSKMDFAEIAARRAQGFVTTFYICCSTHFPNAFTYSDPYEAELLGWYGVAHDYDGMLRWSYNSWPMRPEYDARFRNWASGDTFFIYPYARTSMRFERLVDGIEVAEKIRTLRAKYAGREELKQLEEVLAQFRAAEFSQRSYGWDAIMAEAQQTLHEVSVALTK